MLMFMKSMLMYMFIMSMLMSLLRSMFMFIVSMLILMVLVIIFWVILKTSGSYHIRQLRYNIDIHEVAVHDVQDVNFDVHIDILVVQVYAYHDSYFILFDLKISSSYHNGQLKYYIDIHKVVVHSVQDIYFNVHLLYTMSKVMSSLMAIQKGISAQLKMVEQG